MSFFTTTQIERMVEIVNKAISRAGFKNLNAAQNDFDRDDSFSGGGFIKWADKNNNPVSKIFNQAATNRIGDKGQFFHFKSYEIAKQIISNRSIQMSNLLSNEENDFAEFSEFYKRLGLFHQLIPNDYCSQLDNKIYRPGSVSAIDEIRDNILILCFSKDRHNEKFWDEYAKSESGVCLTFRFMDFDYDKSEVYDFRDVCYDKGYMFDFINEINYHFRKEFQRHLFTDGISRFSKFYKRGSYNWENETRICFNYDFKQFGEGEYLNKIFQIERDLNSSRKYIELPLKGNNKENPFFTLTIDEVICGKNVSPGNYQLLCTNLKENFPDAKIWQRK